MDHGRDPCPWVILNDFGGAFCMGVRFSLCCRCVVAPFKADDDMRQYR